MFTEGYVGISTHPKTRFSQHKCNGFLSGKDYKDDVKMDILLCGSKEYCYVMENKLRPTTFIGWNKQKGGKWSPGALIGHVGYFKGKKFTEEHRDNISKGLIGNKNNLGNHHTEETKKLISEKEKGKKVSKETRQKLSSSHKGKHQTPETIKKMSTSHTGKKMNLSDEERKRRSERLSISNKSEKKREALRKYRTGRKLLPTTIEKMKGHIPWNKGKKGYKQPRIKNNVF